MLRKAFAPPLVLLASLALTTAVCLAQEAAPPLEIPPDVLKTALSQAYVAQIDARVKYYADRFQEVGGDEDIVALRKKVLDDYRKYDSTEYQYVFTQTAVKYLSPLLQEPNQTRQVNVAMALSQMEQVPVQPALESMIKDENPAVRYLGWQGYKRIRMSVLAQGSEGVETMYASLARAAENETEASVVKAIFQMLYLPPIRPEAVSEQSFSVARKRSLDILRKCWPKRCREVLAGSAAMADAARAGVVALLGFENLSTEDPAVQTALLQMLVDILYCSSKAYDAAHAAGNVAEVNSDLMQDAENALNAVSKLRLSQVTTALLDPKVQPPREAAVGLAVLDWIDALKSKGVKKPDFPSVSATAPAGE
jgi:hypothetical protein